MVDTGWNITSFLNLLLHKITRSDYFHEAKTKQRDKIAYNRKTFLEISIFKNEISQFSTKNIHMDPPWDKSEILKILSLISKLTGALDVII